MTAFISTRVLKTYLKDLEKNGCRVQTDFKDALTAVAYDGDVKVLAALQKGKGGHWIVRLAASERITWK